MVTGIQIFFKPPLFFQTKANKNGQPRALYFQKHLYEPRLCPEFVTIAPKIMARGIGYRFNQRRGGPTLGLLSSDPLSASPAQLSLSGQLTPPLYFPGF